MCAASRTRARWRSVPGRRSVRPCASRPRPGSAEPGTGLAAADVVRRLVERRVPALGVAGLAGHQQVAHAPAAFGSFPRRRADTGLPADPGLARPQRVAERAVLRLVLKQGHRHKMIMPVSLVLALVRRKDLTRSGWVTSVGVTSVRRDGRMVAVLGFTIAHGKIVAIDVLADPERLSRLDSMAG